MESAKQSNQDVLNDSFRQRLSLVKVADLCDGSRSLGQTAKIANGELRPVVPFSSIIGTAVTARTFLIEGHYDYHEQLGQFYELGQSHFSAVVVLRCEVPGLVNWGSGGSWMARAHGYTAAVVHGNVRDTDDIRAMDFPVFATGLCPKSIGIHDTPAGHSIRIEIGQPVDIAGLEVHQGDIIVADNDGLIAISPKSLAPALIEAEKLVQRGEQVKAKLDQGKKFWDIIDAWRKPCKHQKG